ncbi:baseplate J/gp47 family protein [Neptunomonas antarctica]|uniref:baseplate J/gp47 family protein n=1 Tax=Neptunomonas antarctica TaxID=619304 RepID=UPI00138EE499|nr:baseplate J/gp47 family protein [Neptunomonas antarctica]
MQYNVAQLFDDTADATNLLRRAAEVGIYQIAASRAAGTMTFSGTDAAQIPAETLLQDDSQLIYRVTVTAVIVAGSAVVQVAAAAAGVTSNQLTGAKLRLMQPVLDIDSEATVISLAGGADIESISRVKKRLSARRKNPPMGGNQSDYIAWAKAAHTDVTRAWCYPNGMGIGTVLVRFVTDNLSSAIATQAHIDAVTNYIDSRRPAGMAGFYIGALTAKPLDITFTRLEPLTAAVKAAIAAALNDLISREGEPGGELLLSQINEEISLASGERDHRISLADNFSCAAHEFPVLGVLAWPT